MANDRHLAMIKRSVEAWNKWKDQHPEIRPDLSNADLSDLNLEDVNLSSADCQSIDLHGAYLNGANLSGSDFSGANLEEANLELAKLCGTNLRGAQLGSAKLISADLSDANLDNIDLNYADLSFACLNGAHLTNASLEEATLVEVQAVGADVSWTDLNSADLNGSDFSNANFYHSDLNSVNLERSSLTNANLNDTDLSSANLSIADLSDANLIRAILDGCDLSGTNLSKANLTGAKLADVDFTDAIIEFTIFANSDLSEAKGLETIQHKGPSSIGLDMVYQSRGKIPAEFLRGAGVPEELISSLISWAEAPLIHHHSCFISHSSKDQRFAERLYHDLRGKGIRCWYAPEDLKAGEKFRLVIDQKIRRHDRLLLILSKNSIESVWVEKETETALEIENKKKRTILLPVRVDDAVMEIEDGWPADIRRTRHIGDFRGWENEDRYQKSIDRLMHDLEIERADESNT